MESEVRDLLVEELKDSYSAEKQALRCMQKALRMASAPALREGASAPVAPVYPLPDQCDRLLIDRGGVPGLDGREVRFAWLIASACPPTVGVEEVGRR